MNNPFFFQVETQLYHGIHSSKKLSELIHKNNAKKPLILCDENLFQTKVIAEYLDGIIQDFPKLICLQTRSNKEPDYTYLDEISEKVSVISPDLIIAFGGGSTLDLAKAVSVLQTNSGNSKDYRGFDKVEKPGIPLIAIPTTAGTGSEVTYNASFIDLDEKVKLGINGKFLNPKIAILDPIFLPSAPEKVAVSSGIDALVHAIESFTCKQATSVTKHFSKLAFALLMNNIETIIDDPSDLDKQLNIQLGAFYAGIAMTNSGSGIAAGISYPLGVHYHIPHGICGGMFLVPEIEYNINNGYEGYSEFYDLIDRKASAKSDKEKSDYFLERIKHLVQKLQIPISLHDFGIKKSDYNAVYESMQILQACFDQNPIKLDIKDVNIFLEPFF